jgi:hypothetical protein
MSMLPVASARDIVYSRDQFLDAFFAFSTVSSLEREDVKNIGCLFSLQKRGYTIDKTRVVFGRCCKYWPLLTDAGGRSSLAGLVTGVRGSSGSSLLSLSHYLQSLTAENHQRRVVPLQEPISGAPASQAEPPSQQPKMPLTLGYSLAHVVSPNSLSLKEFRQMWIFREPPPAPVNRLQEEDLLGATLTVFYTGKYMIHSGAQILSCSSGLKIHYDQCSDSDIPCDDAVHLQSPLTDREKLRTILPYLQGIPLFQP